MNLAYETHILPLSDEDGGGYLAVVPALPGCMSDGETPHEALNNALDAISCWLDEAAALGREVPEPVRAYA